MKLEAAIDAMRDGEKISHEYLLHTQTKSLRIIDGEFVDEDGYVLDKLKLMLRLKSACFNNGWYIIEKS